MRKIICALLTFGLLISCKAQEEPKQFSEKALKDFFVTLKGEQLTFQDILDKHKGEIIVVDVWASWCGDCLKGLPKLKEIQKQFPNVSYVFLSLDKKVASWKKGVERYNIKGSHYYMSSGWKGDFGDFLDLDWIPRYLVINKNQNISVFNAVRAKDNKIINALKVQ